MPSGIFLCLSQARINWEGRGRKGIRSKNGGINGGGLLIGPDEWRQPRLLVCLPLLILLSTIKSRRSFLLAPAHPGRRRKRAVKRLQYITFGVSRLMPSVQHKEDISYYYF